MVMVVSIAVAPRRRLPITKDMKIMVDWIKRLLRLSGRRAPPSAVLEPLSEGADNRAHGLETDHRTLAPPHGGGAGPDSPGELAAESGAEHGVRGRAGGPAELAPHLATRAFIPSPISTGSRVFTDLLTRVLELPDVGPTPDPGEPTARYLAALRAADRNDWRPLMDIWRRRIEGALP